VIIEIARAIVLVLGLSVIFAFVHLVLAFIEDIPEAEHEVISHENSDIENSDHETSKTIHTKHKLCHE
jgi:Na+-transporting methylmalonyl-CoA/oxaloacetate decarboxylase gamma subunit